MIAGFTSMKPRFPCVFVPNSLIHFCRAMIPGSSMRSCFSIRLISMPLFFFCALVVSLDLQEMIGYGPAGNSELLSRLDGGELITELFTVEWSMRGNIDSPFDEGPIASRLYCTTMASEAQRLNFRIGTDRKYRKCPQ